MPAEIPAPCVQQAMKKYRMKRIHNDGSEKAPIKKEAKIVNMYLLYTKLYIAWLQSMHDIVHFNLSWV